MASEGRFPTRAIFDDLFEPEEVDPEDFDNTGQEAKLGKKSEEFDGTDVLVPQRSTLRSKNAPLLEGGRYAGKNKSRKTASDSDSEDGGSEDDDVEAFTVANRAALSALISKRFQIDSGDSGHSEASGSEGDESLRPQGAFAGDAVYKGGDDSDEEMLEVADQDDEDNSNNDDEEDTDEFDEEEDEQILSGNSSNNCTKNSKINKSMLSQNGRDKATVSDTSRIGRGGLPTAAFVPVGDGGDESEDDDEDDGDGKSNSDGNETYEDALDETRLLDEDSDDMYGDSEEDSEKDSDDDEDEEEDSGSDANITIDMSPTKSKATLGDSDGSSKKKKPLKGADEESAFQNFSAVNLEGEITKGKAVQAQLALWDRLLELRIKMESLVQSANQLPQPDTWAQFVADDKKEPKNSQLVAKGILDGLLSLQKAQLSSISDCSPVVSQPGFSSPKKKRKLDSYETDLDRRFKAYKTHRNDTIQKWYDRTRLTTGKASAKSFSAFDQSAIKQMEQVMGDSENLIKRTQMKRGTYRILGKEESRPEVGDDTAEEAGTDGEFSDRIKSSFTKELDEEIFDDGDFYQQLLREFIEQKARASQDPLAMSRQWLEIQRSRRKIKGNIDTKASKGRKVRYHTHQRLVNFMPPVERPSEWTEEVSDELFGSLFGKRYEDFEKPQ